MIEAILFLGLLGLFASHRQLQGRVASLARELAVLRREAEARFERVVEPAVPADAARVAEPEVEREEVPVRETVVFVPRADPAPAFAAPRESLSTAFERLVGGRLLIWTGGIAMALAGLFLVRYSIEIGLIGPRVRMCAAAVFGAGLVGAGEWARRRLPDDPRVGQALVGAGVLVLYATAYGSHILYGLIGLGTAFALMTVVAAGALALSLRHGAPTAALGLVGAFLTPLLVGDPQAGARPLLIYLGLLNLAVFAVAAKGDRPMLAFAARWLTLGWTAWLLGGSRAEVPTIALFVLVFTVASILALRGRDERWPSLAPSVAGLQLASAVFVADFAPQAWAMVLAFAVAGFVGAGRYRALDAVPGRTLLGTLLLLATQVVSRGLDPVPVSVAALAVFGIGGWLRFGRGAHAARWAAIFCLGVAGPVLLLRWGRGDLLTDAGWGALLAALSLLPAALAWRARGSAREEPPFDAALLIAAGSAAVLAMLACSDLLPEKWWPIGWTALALVVAAAGLRLRDGGVSRLAAVVAGAGVLAAVAQAGTLWTTLLQSIGGKPALVTGLVAPVDAALLFGGPALLLAILWNGMRARAPELARAAAGGAAAFALLTAYVAYKQGFALRNAADFAARGFAERVLLTQGAFAAGWVLTRARGWERIGWALTALAAARFVWFDLLVLDPVVVRQVVGGLPILNLLLPAFFGSAWWFWAARARAPREEARALWLGGFLAASIAGAGLLVRQAFQGAVLVGGVAGRSEFYGYSLAGLALAVALLFWGWRLGDRPIRVAGLAVLTATVVKVFAVDAAALSGVLRILSFAGLGLALIGVGKLYGTLLGRGSAAAPA